MITTEILKVNRDAPEHGIMDRAAAVIRAGRLVAFPTETVYGLGADAMNGEAVLAIFRAKERPADNPLIVHVSDNEMLELLVNDIPEEALRLIDRFWPGPLTLVFSRRPGVADCVSRGLSTIAVRMPASPIALDLIRRAKTPIAAPSANLSGRPSPTRAQDVFADLNGRIGLILDGGPTTVGIESTVLDLTGPPVILRPGLVTRSQLEDVIGPIVPEARAEELRRSPGTRHRHYSPKAHVVLVLDGAKDDLRSITAGFLDRGKVGFIGFSDLGLPADLIKQILLQNDLESYARSLYSAFRDLDEAGVAVIVVQVAALGDGASDAIIDRLSRAASETIIRGGTSL